MSVLERKPPFSRFIAFWRAIDWTKPAVRDGLFVLAAFGVTFAVFEIFKLPHPVLEYSIKHQEWELDDLIVSSFVAVIGLLLYAWRRHKDLKREVDLRRAAEVVAQRLARHDPLTGLPNRRFFNERLDEALKGIASSGRSTAVLMLDLDGFKLINDVHGHFVGDKALVEFAARVGAVAKCALIARVGGDEFGIILPDLASLDEPAALAQRISSAVAKPFTIAGTETTLGVGIGIAIAPDDGTHAEELVRRADLALYRAKADGRSLTRFFEPAMDTHVERRLIIERELRSAIATNQIAVHYQPLIGLLGDRIIGFEALARWNSPALGDVPPDVFIPVAEETGLIHRLGDQLLRIACREAKTWPEDLTLAFNISPLQLRDVTFGLHVLEILGETGLPASRLELEITESAVVGDGIQAQRLIDELRAAGVHVALDDFGTGYATMSQLLSFRFDKIKIDRSFVQNLGHEGNGDVIVRAIIGLAKGLGLTTAAEGIETQTQLTELITEGCIEGQGFLFGKPVPAAEIPRLIKQRRISGQVA